MKVKVESEKVGLKLNIQKTKIMASGPITSWHIDGVARRWVPFSLEQEVQIDYTQFKGGGGMIYP